MPAKTAEEKQIERQWMILHELDRQSRATKGVTKQELADLCGVSKRTIDRDMIDLSLSRFPVRCQQEGRVKTWRLQEGYQLEFPPVELNPAECLSLILAEEALTFLAGTPHYRSFCRAMGKIRQAIPPDNDRLITKVSQAFAFRFPHLKDAKRVSPMIEQAQQAVTRQQRLQLTYRSAGSGETTSRQIDPYGIYYANNALRLVGYCHLRQGIREFNFDGRMIEVELLEERFEKQADFDLLAYSDTGFGGVRNQTPVEAVVQVGPPVSRWVREQDLKDLSQTVELGNDWIELHFQTDGQEGLLRQVLAWGSCARVVGSDVFKQAFEREIRQMYQQLD